MNTKKTIWVALPSMDEIDFIPKTIDCICNQTYRNFRLVVCVNQPEKYHSEPCHQHIVESNQKTIQLLREIKDFPVEIIDKSSKGNGWDDTMYGVGWARKLIFDCINFYADEKDIVISIDADTRFSPSYFQSVLKEFYKHRSAVALSVPYYHELTGNKILDRSILRYEMYVRYFTINLMRINSPYGYSALGSAIAFPVWAYRKIKGLTAKYSGEDFYLLQKLRKTGRVLKWIPETVYPATRYSDRVFFGTGPAIIQGSNGNWNSYPLYDYVLFDNIAETYQAFPSLFIENQPTKLDTFMREVLKTEPEHIWSLLRKNNRDIVRFVHACHTKIDGLRILQYLKYQHAKNTISSENSDETVLKGFIDKYFSQYSDLVKDFSFSLSSIEHLNEIRNKLLDIENLHRMLDGEKNHELHCTKSPERWKYLGL